MGIFARNTVRNSIVFRATTNSIEKNTTKKQNTRRYTLKIKVSDVCWIGGGGESRAFSGAPRSAIINGVLYRNPLCIRYIFDGKAFCSRKTAPSLESRRIS